MGAKIEFAFLINCNNKEVLHNIIFGLFQNEITYNKGVQGKYTYWIDGPIWQLGDSRTILENKETEYDTIFDMKDIICLLSKYFSPSITFGIVVGMKEIPLTLSIFENEGSWKEAVLSLDRYDAYDSQNIETRKNTIGRFQDIFNSVVLNMSPYYGVCATEISGLPASAERLCINEESMGDLTYLSSALLSQDDREKYEQNYYINTLSNGGHILIKRKNLFALGT